MAVINTCLIATGLAEMHNPARNNPHYNLADNMLASIVIIAIVGICWIIYRMFKKTNKLIAYLISYAISCVFCFVLFEFLHREVRFVDSAVLPAILGLGPYYVLIGNNKRHASA